MLLSRRPNWPLWQGAGTSLARSSFTNRAKSIRETRPVPHSHPAALDHLSTWAVLTGFLFLDRRRPPPSRHHPLPSSSRSTSRISLHTPSPSLLPSLHLPPPPRLLSQFPSPNPPSPAPRPNSPHLGPPPPHQPPAMGKIADPLLNLRCVHCGNTETPLWRAGPDGPKTLCNACGVRYKKGKLTLFRDKNGNLTAVKQEDTPPVHVPPAPKKASKKHLHHLHHHHASDPPAKPAHYPIPTSAQTDPAAPRRAPRKVPAEGVLTAALAKKPRSRSRRTNAGQLPGRYSSKSLPDDFAQLQQSPLSSPKSYASSPAQSPRNDGKLLCDCVVL